MTRHSRDPYAIDVPYDRDAVGGRLVWVNLAGERYRLRRPGRYREYCLRRMLRDAERHAGRPREWAAVMAAYDRLLPPGRCAELEARLIRAETCGEALTLAHLKAGLRAAFGVWRGDRARRDSRRPPRPRPPRARAL